MKIVGFFVIITSSILLGDVSSTCFALGSTPRLAKYPSLSSSFAKIVRGGHYSLTSDADAVQKLGKQYELLHEALVSSVFSSQVEQQFHSFWQALEEARVLFGAETMLYVAALAGSRDAATAALALKKHDFDLGHALELAMKDEPNWDALQFMVDLDRQRAQRDLDGLIVEPSRDGDEELVGKLIAIGASPTQALTIAALYGNEKLASHVIELGADLHQSLYEIKGDEEAGKFLLELGADANLALLGFARDHNHGTWKSLVANYLINKFGADPLLVLMYVEKNTEGFAYLNETFIRYSNINLAFGRATTLNHRPALIKNTEQFAQELESFTPEQARQVIEKNDVNVGLALLYLARDGDEIMAKYLIDRFGANPAAVAALAQAGGEADTAAFLRQLAE